MSAPPPQPHEHQIRSEIAWSDATSITVRGRDLADDILGHVSLGDFAYLLFTGEVPDAAVSRMFNAMLITLVEHGITPSVLAARLTYAGAPEALQAAVAAGLCGLGSVFVGSTEGAARMLSEALPAGHDANLPAIASNIVAAMLERREVIPGIGHPIHKPEDPRAVRLFEIAAETGFAGDYVALMGLVARQASEQSGKSLPVNATGAVAAVCCEMGLPWKFVRGFGVMARAIGLVGHLREESESPLALEVWRRTEREAAVAAAARPAVAPQ
jgi:citrate synthase